jgi:hypothetical protein
MARSAAPDGRERAAPAQEPASPAKRKLPIRRGYRIGFAITGVLLLVTAVLMPIAFVDLVRATRARLHDEVRVYAALHALPAVDPPYVRARVDIVGLDELQRTETLRVNAVAACVRDCDFTYRLTFYAVNGEVSGPIGVPPAESVSVPADGKEVTTKFDLPITASLLLYPFDENVLQLGVTLERVGANTQVTPIPAPEGLRQLQVKLDEQLPAVQLRELTNVDPATVRPADVPNFDYLAVASISLERPVYRKILTLLALVMIAIASIYAVWLRPFDQLIINAGALVLGIYGVRSLLLGSYPPDATILDIALIGVALFVLFSIGMRGVMYLHEKGGLRLPMLPKEKSAPETRTCPFCGTQILKEATRCPNCTSDVPPADAQMAEALATD